MNGKRLIPFKTVTGHFTMSLLSFLIVTATVAVLGLSQGCTLFTQGTDSKGEFSDETSVRTPPLPMYYDFEDISVPPELMLVKKRSFIYETQETKSGILVFKGRFDVASLVSFFKENMSKDGWALINSYKYKDYILNFQKDGKSCLISLYDKLLNTVVEIRVGSFREDVEIPQ